MGERYGWLFEPTFNRSIKLRQADPRITSDAGALLLREVDHRLGLTADLAAGLYDPRDPAYTRYTQTELLRRQGGARRQQVPGIRPLPSHRGSNHAGGELSRRP